MAEPLIEQYLAWLHICGRSPKTIDARREILDRMDRVAPYGLAAATADELKECIYRDHFKEWTRVTYYGAARSFFTWATSPLDPKLDFDPTDLLPRPHGAAKIPNPVTDAELQHILTNAVEPYLTWSTIAAYTGARCCEIAALHREHVDEQHVRMVRRKGGKPGVVATHPAVWEAIRDLPPGPIAWTAGGVPATAQYISLYSANYFKRQLKLRVSMHRLRSWFITMFYRETKDLLETAAAAGHATPNSTKGYVLLQDEKRAAGIRALPTFTSP